MPRAKNSTRRGRRATFFPFQVDPDSASEGEAFLYRPRARAGARRLPAPLRAPFAVVVFVAVFVVALRVAITSPT
jgi:hypothetical protein